MSDLTFSLSFLTLGAPYRLSYVAEQILKSSFFFLCWRKKAFGTSILYCCHSTNIEVANFFHQVVKLGGKKWWHCIIFSLKHLILVKVFVEIYLPRLLQLFSIYLLFTQPFEFVHLWCVFSSYLKKTNLDSEFNLPGKKNWEYSVLIICRSKKKVKLIK